MDEDGKTLLAILALLYGSSNGVGLFKAALEPLEEQTTATATAIKDHRADDSYVSQARWKLFKSMWSYGVLVYVLLVLIPPAFLALVVLFGAEGALNLIGLGTGKPTPPGAGPSLFYIVLLVFLGLSSLHLLAPYLKAWRTLAKRRPASSPPQ